MIVAESLKSQKKSCCRKSIASCVMTSLSAYVEVRIRHKSATNTDIMVGNVIRNNMHVLQWRYACVGKGVATKRRFWRHHGSSPFPLGRGGEVGDLKHVRLVLEHRKYVTFTPRAPFTPEWRHFNSKPTSLSAAITMTAADVVYALLLLSWGDHV